MSDLIDISRTIEAGALVYPGDSPIEFETICDIGPSCPCRITSLKGWSTHFLTHVDAPRHFIAEGVTLDEMPLDRFVGRARVVSALGDAIDEGVLAGLDLQPGDNLLFKSRHSGPLGETFDEGHVYVTRGAAERLVEARVNLVGVDYLSVDAFGDEDYPAHRTLLGSGILILEAVNLQNVALGAYELHALPLKIKAADGSPVRAVLRSIR